MSNDNATLTACREALAAMEQAEAAMTQGPWHWADNPPDMLLGGLSDHYICTIRDATSSGNYTLDDYIRMERQGNRAGIALLRNAAPGTLRGWRTLLEMCEAAMLSDAQITELNQARAKCPPPYVLPEGWAALTRHDFALAILAALADAMGVTGGGNG